MQKRFIGAWLGILIYKAIAWSISTEAYSWSDEPLKAVIIALFVTAAQALQEWWLGESDTTASETEVSEAT